MCTHLPRQEGDEEVEELLQHFKVLVGLSSDDPPDSEWIKMEKTDRATGKKVRRVIITPPCGFDVVPVASRRCKCWAPANCF